jgi:phosphotransferase system HPr (HPr) family protein
MSIMALGIKTGEEIKIIADGKDASDAIAEIETTMKQAELI